MQTKYLCVLIHIWINGEVGAPLKQLKPSSKSIFYWPFQGGASFVDCVCYLCFRLALWNWFKPSSKIFYWPFQGGTSFVDLLCIFVLCLLCLCVRLFICALWSPAGKGLISWLSFVVSYCELVTFPLVSWVRCGILRPDKRRWAVLS